MIYLLLGNECKLLFDISMNLTGDLSLTEKKIHLLTNIASAQKYKPGWFSIVMQHLSKIILRRKVEKCYNKTSTSGLSTGYLR